MKKGDLGLAVRSFPNSASVGVGKRGLESRDGVFYQSKGKAGSHYRTRNKIGPTGIPDGAIVCLGNGDF